MRSSQSVSAFVASILSVVFLSACGGGGGGGSSSSAVPADTSNGAENGSGTNTNTGSTTDNGSAVGSDTAIRFSELVSNVSFSSQPLGVISESNVEAVALETTRLLQAAIESFQPRASSSTGTLEQNVNLERSFSNSGACGVGGTFSTNSFGPNRFQINNERVIGLGGNHTLSAAQCNNGLTVQNGGWQYGVSSGTHSLDFGRATSFPADITETFTSYSLARSATDGVYLNGTYKRIYQNTRTTHLESSQFDIFLASSVSGNSEARLGSVNLSFNRESGFTPETLSMTTNAPFLANIDNIGLRIAVFTIQPAKIRQSVSSFLNSGEIQVTSARGRLLINYDVSGLTYQLDADQNNDFEVFGSISASEWN